MSCGILMSSRSLLMWLDISGLGTRGPAGRSGTVPSYSHLWPTLLEFSVLRSQTCLYCTYVQDSAWTALSRPDLQLNCSCATVFAFQ